MGVYYFDSSALVKRYAQEVGSAWITSLTGPLLTNSIFIALVTGAEMVAAVARKVRVGAIPPQDAQAALTAFKNHFKTEYLVVLVHPALVDLAMDLAERHGLRGYDAIQLASALTVQAELNVNGATLTAFVSADTNLNEAARGEGLAVENPLDHP
jgi:uncharacterized protein